MVAEGSTKLGSEKVRIYQERGCYFPVRVFDDSEVADFRRHFNEYLSFNIDRLKELEPRQHVRVFGHTHMFLAWVYRIVSHQNVLDAVESILGPNLLVWDTGWFAKLPGDKKYISWHQDATYWGLHPPNVATAWVALSESIPENGCMRVIPGTHRTPPLAHRDTYAPNSGLSRGQEIAVEVDESQAVDIVLRPGEMSLHHVGIAHGSKANTSDKPRIGIAIRYISPEVIQDGPVRQLALLVRGRDDYGHFDVIEPPQRDDPSKNEMQTESLGRILKNVLAGDTANRTGS